MQDISEMKEEIFTIEKYLCLGKNTITKIRKLSIDEQDYLEFLRHWEREIMQEVAAGSLQIRYENP